MFGQTYIYVLLYSCYNEKPQSSHFGSSTNASQCLIVQIIWNLYFNIKFQTVITIYLNHWDSKRFEFPFYRGTQIIFFKVVSSSKPQKNTIF